MGCSRMGKLFDHQATVVEAPYGHIAIWTDEGPFYTELHLSVVRQNRAIEHSLGPKATAGLLRAIASEFRDQLAREWAKINDRIEETKETIKELEERLKELPEKSGKRGYYEAKIAEAKECLETLEARRASVERAQLELRNLIAVLTELAETDAL